MADRKQAQPSATGKLSRKKKLIATLYSIGLGEQVESFYEDLSILLGSGMDIVSAVKAIHEEMRSRRMRAILKILLDEIEAGASFAHTLQELNIAPGFILALVKVGEESGNLEENLKVAVMQMKRMKEFTSKVKSAMLYPSIVLGLTVIVGLGTTWFILPRLTGTFTSLNVELPTLTRGLVAVGDFVSRYGSVVIPPVVIVMAILMYFMFVFRGTRFIGARLLFSLPITKNIVRHSEVARFGFLLGVLLKAGLPIVHALDSMFESTELRPYRRLYAYMRKNIESGDSFRAIFKKYKRSTSLIPVTAQYMLEAGERSGSLPEALLMIGDAFEGKTSVHLRTITTVLEPVIIIIVGLGVVIVAFSILMPIYTLIGGIR